jgi:hypothetical protein
MNPLEEHIATYIYDLNDPDGVYEVYAIYDTLKDMDDRTPSFYDLFNKEGICVNEGNPYYNVPSWEYVYNKYYIPSTKASGDDHLSFKAIF